MYPFTDDEAEAIKAMREAFDSEGLGLVDIVRFKAK